MNTPRLNLIDINTGSNAAAVIPPTLVNSYSAMAIPAFRRAVAFLSENLASFPRAVHLDGATAAMQDTPHPLDDLLRRRPNQYQTHYSLWRTWYAHAAQSGNGYLQIERDNRMQPIGLHNLMPENVHPVRFWVEGADWPEQYYLIRSSRRVVPGADILHLQSLGYDGMVGTDPVTQHAGTFQMAHTLGKFQVQYLQKGTVIRGAIEIPGDVPTDRLEQMVDMLRRHFYGSDADRDVLMLTNGAKLNNATVSPHESKIIEQGATLTKQIAQITGVPPEFLFELSEAKYNGSVEQAGQNVVRYTFRPWIRQAEDEMSAKLLSVADQRAGYTVRINPDALLRGDTSAVNQSAISTKNAGIRTPNEARALLNLPPIDDASADRLATLGDTQATNTTPEKEIE